MPDIESLMQEWPQEFEDLLNQVFHININIYLVFYSAFWKVMDQIVGLVEAPHVTYMTALYARLLAVTLKKFLYVIGWASNS